jgi:hypothetical protein
MLLYAVTQTKWRKMPLMRFLRRGAFLLAQKPALVALRQKRPAISSDCGAPKRFRTRPHISPKAGGVSLKGFFHIGQTCFHTVRLPIMHFVIPYK